MRGIYMIFYIMIWKKSRTRCEQRRRRRRQRFGTDFALDVCCFYLPYSLATTPPPPKKKNIKITRTTDLRFNMKQHSNTHKRTGVHARTYVRINQSSGRAKRRHGRIRNRTREESETRVCEQTRKPRLVDASDKTTAVSVSRITGDTLLLKITPSLAPYPRLSL